MHKKIRLDIFKMLKISSLFFIYCNILCIMLGNLKKSFSKLGIFSVMKMEKIDFQMGEKLKNSIFTDFFYVERIFNEKKPKTFSYRCC